VNFVFIIKIYYDARSSESQKNLMIFRLKQVRLGSAPSLESGVSRIQVTNVNDFKLPCSVRPCDS
jgi:hypothetical protein